MTSFKGNTFFSLRFLHFYSLRSIYYERPVGPFQLHEFTISFSWIHNLNFVHSRFQNTEFTYSGFSFMNSRLQLHEFTISTLRIHDFNFMNSRFQLHEFTISTSRIQLHEFNFLNSWWIQLLEFMISTSQFKISTSWSWNHDFVKLK
jgi:hypothetical protein